MLKLWYEREMDDRLGIETTALREWNDPEREQYYYRTESTPYQALDELFAHYRFPLQAHLVDFGCGTGRMAFYAHRYFNIPVTGIELNEETFADLEANISGYQMKTGQELFNPPLEFVHGYAEQFSITEDHNVFYLFNPFSLDIFYQVIGNIEQSFFAHPRAIDVILYYPLFSIQRYMDRGTIFERRKAIQLAEIFEDEHEKFLLYSVAPDQ